MAWNDPPNFGANDPRPDGYRGEGREPVPGWRTPIALVGWGVLIAVLIGVIIYGILELTSDQEMKPATPTTASTTTATTPTTTTTTTTTSTTTPTTTTTTQAPGTSPNNPTESSQPHHPHHPRDRGGT